MKRVYFIKPVGMDGPVKIGCSQSPTGRRDALDGWSPFALEIVAEISGDFDLERRFHALFAETHQRREWFRFSPLLGATIKAIRNGTFDIAALPAPLVVTSSARRGKGSRAGEWNPARRFAVAYDSRLRALKKRHGLSWEELLKDRPQFPVYALGCASYASRHKFPDDPVSIIRECEAYAARLTAKYGHSRMKPVLWRGPLPRPEASAA